MQYTKVKNILSVSVYKSEEYIVKKQTNKKKNKKTKNKIIIAIIILNTHGI